MCYVAASVFLHFGIFCSGCVSIGFVLVHIFMRAHMHRTQCTDEMLNARTAKPAVVFISELHIFSVDVVIGSFVDDDDHTHDVRYSSSAYRISCR